MTSRLGAALAVLSWFGMALAQEAPADLQARLATAKLAETRGDLVTAERELLAALEQAMPGEKAQVDAMLRTLRQRLGRGGGASGAPSSTAQDPAARRDLQPGQDPIEELVAMLDRDLLSESVDIAKKELSMLGGLVVPHLLAALLKFGPFGLTNALSLLAAHDDPRIAAALAQLVDKADPTVAVAIAERLRSMPRSVVLGLAQKLAEPTLPMAAQLGVLRALVAHDPEGEATRQLALRIAADPSARVQRTVLDAFDKAQPAWVGDVYAVLRDGGEPSVRRAAAFLWVSRQKDLGEEATMQALLGGGCNAWACASLAEKNPGWVRLAQAALGIAAKEGEPDEILNHPFVDAVDWWRDADRSSALMLALPIADHPARQSAARLLRRLVERGWRAAPDQDARVAQVLLSAGSTEFHRVLVDALPADAEGRAIVLCDGLAPAQAAALVHLAVQAERPWHRLVARQLAAAKTFPSVQGSLLDRDWTGAPPEAVEALVSLARRWPEAPVSLANQTTWHYYLLGAYGRCTNLPADVILPLVEVGITDAWQVLVARDPAAALAFARRAGRVLPHEVQSLVALVRRHGGPADLQVMLQVVRVAKGVDGETSSVLRSFFAVHAPGHVELVRLARIPMEAPTHLRSFVLQLADQAAQAARIEDLEALLALLPQLQVGCAESVAAALMPQVRGEHASVLLAAAETCLARPLAYTVDRDSVQQPIGSADLLQWLVRLLGSTGDGKALPVLRRVMALPDASPELVSVATHAALQVAGPTRRALLLELLASPRPEVAAVAVALPDLRTDAELRTVARPVVLRLGEAGLVGQDVFKVVEEPDRIALAEAVLGSERLSYIDHQLVTAALGVLGRRKDATFLAVIVRAATHPNHEVRRTTAVMLGNTFAREAAPHLLELLKDDRQEVRSAAQKALDEIANYLDARAKWEARLR